MAIDTIAVFHAFAGPVCAWGCAEGIVTTLSRMQYGVIDCGRPPMKRVNLDSLKRADLIILCGPEHFWPLIEQEYEAEWNRLSMPKVAWYTESAYRDDRTFDFRGLKGIADVHYYPAIQDAEEFGGNWLPFGADIEMFHPKPVANACAAGFIGNLYPKRLEYVQSLTCPLTHIRPGQHPHVRRSFELLAEAYCCTDIFVNLPAYSRLLVTKLTEVMACGTMLITPAIDHPSGLKNMAQFENGRHVVYYDPARPAELGELVNHYLLYPEQREAIARAGRNEVRRGHSLETRLQAIISDVEFGRAASSPFVVAEGAISRRARNQPVAEKRYRLKTAWDSFAYYDGDAGIIGHARPDVVPHNFCLTVNNLRASLTSVGPNNSGGAQLRYEHPSQEWFEPGSTQGIVRLHESRNMPDCDLEFVGTDQVLIRHRNNYLSADPDGIIRNDRNWALDHEIFHLVEFD